LNTHSKEIWEEDQKKLKDLADLGYKIKVIWEHDYKLNKDNVLKELVDE
jgi:G:T-mismatch repair DNA endonuclease (very short patch repair protein)